MKVHFYLDRRKGKSENLPVFLHYWYKGRLLRVFTGEHCGLDGWSKETERVKEDREGATEINELLSSMENEVLSSVREARTAREPLNLEDIKEDLTFLTGKKRDFFDVWDEFIDTESLQKQWTEGTIRRFNTTKKHLMKLNTQYDISFKTINRTFYREFIDYHNNKGLNNNFAQKNIELLRWFLNWATRKGYNKNLGYKKHKPPAYKRDKTSLRTLYLTADEINRICRMETGNPELSVIRDIFCFGCFTGLGYDEIQNLKKRDVTGEKLVCSKKKPLRSVAIPLVDRAKEILNRYMKHPRRSVFPVPKIQYYNRCLKILGREAGLNESFTVQYFVGKKQVEKVFRKWELLSSQTAKRTFIYLGIAQGIGLEILCELTGNSPGTLRSYYQIKRELIEREMHKLDKIDIY